MMTSFYVLMSPILVPYVWLNRKEATENVDQLREVVTESDLTLSWNEGIFVHYLPEEEP